MDRTANRPDLQEKTKHGDMMLPLSIYHPTLGAREKTLFLHWHREIEISYIKRGRALYTVGFESFEVQRGDVMVIPPGCLHSGRAIEGADSENITVVFDLSMLESPRIDGCTTKYIIPLQNGELRFQAHIPDARKSCPGLVERITGLSGKYNQAQPGYELFIKAEAFRLLHLLYCHAGESALAEKRSIDDDADKIKEVIRYVNANFTRELYIGEIAQAVNYSISYLARFFKRATHMTLSEYINKLRIHRAAEMIHATDLSVTEIALEVGFANISYFIKKFREEYDMTPMQYKRLGVQARHWE